MSAVADRILASVKATPRDKLGFVLAGLVGYGVDFSLGDLLTDLAPFIEAEIARPSTDLVKALDDAIRTLLTDGGWSEHPTRINFWIDNRGDDRLSPGTDWPHDSAIGIERDRRRERKAGAS